MRQMRGTPGATRLTLLLVCAGTLAAGPVRALTLDQAVAQALERHPALKAAAWAERGADARVAQAETAWLPRVGLDAGYRYSGPVPELVVETGITPPGAPEPLVIRREAGTEHNAHVAGQAGWRAWDFGARDARSDAAEAAAEATAAEARERAADVALGVRSAFLAVLLFDETSGVTERSLETARQELADAELRRTAGIGDDLGVASAASRVAEMEARLVDARQGRLRALDALRSLLGLPDGAPLEVEGTLADEVAAAAAAAPGTAPGATAGAVDRAAGEGGGTAAPGSAEVAPDHPQLARLEALERAAEHQRAAVSKSAWPTLDLFGRLAYQYPHTFFETDEAGLVWSAGVTIAWEVFDGGLRARQEDELDARAAELDALRQAASESIARDTVDARSRLASALAAADSAERSREAAEVYLRAARAALAAGTGTALDVRRAEEAVDRAHLAAVKARFDGAMARAALLRAEGRAQPEG